MRLQLHIVATATIENIKKARILMRLTLCRFFFLGRPAFRYHLAIALADKPIEQSLWRHLALFLSHSRGRMIRGISLGKFFFGATELITADLVVPSRKIESEPRLAGIALMERTIHAAHGVVVIVVGRIGALRSPEVIEKVCVARFVSQFIDECIGIDASADFSTALSTRSVNAVTALPHLPA